MGPGDGPQYWTWLSRVGACLVYEGGYYGHLLGFIYHVWGIWVRVLVRLSVPEMDLGVQTRIWMGDII